MPITISTPEVRKESTVATHGSSIVLYGPPMSGKTFTLRNNKDWKVLLIDLDKNSGVLHTAENVTVIGVDTVEDVRGIRKAVETGVLKAGGVEIKMDYDMYVIDSFTTFENRTKDYIVNAFAPRRKREIDGRFGCQSDWGDLQDLILEEVKAWHMLTRRSKNPINTLWIGHDMDVMDANGIPSHIQLMLQGKYAAPRIMGMMDACFYMFKQEMANPNDKTQKALVRGIYTMDTGKVKAEARMDIEAKVNFPKSIINPDWKKVYEMMNGIRTSYKDAE